MLVKCSYCLILLDGTNVKCILDTTSFCYCIHVETKWPVASTYPVGDFSVEESTDAPVTRCFAVHRDELKRYAVIMRIFCRHSIRFMHILRLKPDETVFEHDADAQAFVSKLNGHAVSAQQCWVRALMGLSLD